MICNLITGSTAVFYLLIGPELAAIPELTQIMRCPLLLHEVLLGRNNSFRNDLSFSSPILGVIHSWIIQG